MSLGRPIAILVLSVSILPTRTEAAPAVDLRAYFPAVTNLYRGHDGVAHARYEFFFVPKIPSDPFWKLYTTLFDLKKPDGKLLIWRKIYASDPDHNPENLNCTATYGHLYVGGGADKPPGRRDLGAGPGAEESTSEARSEG